VAAFTSFGLLLMCWLLAGLGSLLGDTPAGHVVSYLSFMEHFDHLVRGLVDTKDLVYYVSGTVLHAVPRSPRSGFVTMEMTRRLLPIGAIGTGLAIAGVIAYTLVPDKLWLVTLLEGLALTSP
jgi:hypothetical protein